MIFFVAIRSDLERKKCIFLINISFVVKNEIFIQLERSTDLTPHLDWIGGALILIFLCWFNFLLLYLIFVCNFQTITYGWVTIKLAIVQLKWLKIGGLSSQVRRFNKFKPLVQTWVEPHWFWFYTFSVLIYIYSLLLWLMVWVTQLGSHHMKFVFETLSQMPHEFQIWNLLLFCYYFKKTQKNKKK